MRPGEWNSLSFGTAIPADRPRPSTPAAKAHGKNYLRWWPGFITLTRPTVIAVPSNLEYPTCGIKCAEDIEELIQTETSGEIAAFMAETIIGSGGFIVPPPGYFEKATAIARNYGGLFICDEVQTALGSHRQALVGHSALGCETRHHGLCQGNGKRRSGCDDDRHAGSRR